MPGTLGRSMNNPLNTPGIVPLGTMYPGGVFQIVSGTQANPTEITCLCAHGLTSGDRIFFTNSTTANAALTAVPQQVVTVTSALKFTVPVDCSVAGATAGAFDYSILSIPTTPGAAPLINVGTAHGLRIGDIVTITASGSTPSLDGAQTVTAIDSATSFRVLTSAVPTTVAGSTTAAHYVKTTFYSDPWDTGIDADQVGIAITSVIGTAPVTTLVDIQGSFDGANWFNTSYATMAAPQTLAVAQLTITTATTSNYKLAGPGEANYIPYKYLRLKFGSSTNIIISAQLNALPVS
jgi:hypothetical protein